MLKLTVETGLCAPLFGHAYKIRICIRKVGQLSLFLLQGGVYTNTVVLQVSIICVYT